MGTDGRDPVRNRFRIPLEELERGVRVPVEQQVLSLSTDPPPGPDPDWDEDRRTLRLAGGL